MHHLSKYTIFQNVIFKLYFSLSITHKSLNPQAMRHAFINNLTNQSIHNTCFVVS